MDNKIQLLFVYNADSGAFNKLADMAHKIFSPDTYSCALCSITHGIFQEKEQWRTFVASLPLACRFVHRDEFLLQHPEFQGQLPAIFQASADTLRVCLSADQLKSCHDIQDLQKLITMHCINQLENSTQ